MSAKDQLSELHRKLKELEDQRKKLSEAAFAEMSAGLFESQPKLESFGWCQYTPYFNDGDTCVFSARTDPGSISVNGERGDEILYSNYDYVTRNGKYERIDKPQSEWSPLIPLVQPVADFLANFNDDDLKAMFGDHCEVAVSREGVEVSSYEHD